MRHSETVTFGGSGLDRSAHRRGQSDEISRLLHEPGARFLAVWRGRPLLAGADRDRLGWLSSGHPVLALALAQRPEPVFLGMEAGAAHFALDVSAWEPDGLDPAALTGFFDPSEQRHPSLGLDQCFAELRGVMARLSPRDAELAATAKALLGWHETHRFCARCGAESAMIMAGWQRACAACGGQHFPRTDPVVIMLVTRDNSVLIGRSPGWPEGMYSLLAGFIEPGETMEAAVRREVWEEAGIEVGPVRYLASQPWPFPASLMLGCQGEAISDEIRLDPTEIEDALWITREDMADVMTGSNPKVKPSRKGAIAHFLLSNWMADTLE